MRRDKLLIGTTAVFGLLAAASLPAYELIFPRRTWSCSPTYTVDSSGIASIADGDGGLSRAIDALRSPDAWNGAGSGPLLHVQPGSTAGLQLGDGIPMLRFSDPFSACTGICLAMTFGTYYSERLFGSNSWQIDDADIVFNLNYLWTSQGEDPNGVGCADEMYVESVVVHEVGHALGLAHSGVAGATMSPSLSYCTNTMATTEADDEAGLRFLYGTAPCSTCRPYTQYLPGTGHQNLQPCGGYFYSLAAGLHQGWLMNLSGTDFDLYLDRWNGTAWVQVASATSTGALESLSYSGVGESYYRYRVRSASGRGTYRFWYKAPEFVYLGLIF